MDSFTIIDAIVAIIVVLSALLAYSRGFLRETMAILGWVGATIVAFMFADDVSPLVRQIPYVGDFLAGSCELLILAGFAAVLALALVVASIFAPLLSSLVQRTALNGPDRALGFVFGVIRGILLVAVAFFVYQTMLPGQDIAMIDGSRSAAVFSPYVDNIQDQNPEQAMGWIQRQYDQLIASCN